MARTHQPVSSFGPELLRALQAGSREATTLTFESGKLAIRFRQRIMGLRAAMRKEGHPDWQEVYRCGVYLDVAAKQVTLRPRDSEFASAVANLAPAAPQPTESTEEPSTAILEELPSDPADAFLSTLKGNKS